MTDTPILKNLDVGSHKPNGGTNVGSQHSDGVGLDRALPRAHGLLALAESLHQKTQNASGIRIDCVELLYPLHPCSSIPDATPLLLLRHLCGEAFGKGPHSMEPVLEALRTIVNPGIYGSRNGGVKGCL